MKKLLITVLLCLISVLPKADAETKKYFLENNPVWCYIFTYFGASDDEDEKFDLLASNAEYFFINGETTYEGKLYKLLNIIKVKDLSTEKTPLSVSDIVPVREDDNKLLVPISAAKDLIISPETVLNQVTADGKEYIIYDNNRKSGIFDYFSMTDESSAILLNGLSTTKQEYENLNFKGFPFVTVFNGIGLASSYGYASNFLNPFANYYPPSHGPERYGNVLQAIYCDSVILYHAPEILNDIDINLPVTSEQALEYIFGFHPCARHDEIMEFIKKEQAGVDGVKVDAAETNSKQEGIFDVNGVRLSEPPTSGFYIENGEKKLAK